MIKDIAYHSLSDLIYRGALFLQSDIAGHSIIFKSINDIEYKTAQFQAGLSSKIGYAVKFNILFMAYSVIMVEDENVLINRDENIKKLCDFFKSLPILCYKKILDELMELKTTVQEVGKYLEGFCYTNQSRDMWQLYGRDINKDSSTGICGLEKYGLNEYQEYWVNLNLLLDNEERYHENFSLAIMIASASNPKGSRRLGSQHESKIQRAIEARKKLAKEGYAERVTVWSEEGWALPTDTAEALVAELERQMQGLKDKHDLFVEKYLDGLQEESDKKAQEIERQRQESIKKHEKEPPITVEQRSLSRKEAEEIFAKRGSNNLVIVQSDEIATPEQTERFYKKIGNKVLTPKG